MSLLRAPVLSRRHWMAVVAGLAVALTVAVCEIPTEAHAQAASGRVSVALHPALSSPIVASTATLFGLLPAADEQEGPAEANEPLTCTGCSPPLSYHGGVVMGTPAQAGKITITPIYWVPGGVAELPGGYEPTVDKYIKDIAAASGASNNVYAVNQEYYRASTGAGAGDQMKYSITANLPGGKPIIDTAAYPVSGCTPTVQQEAEGYTKCLTDAAVQEQVTHAIDETTGEKGLQYLYPVFFAPHVEITDHAGVFSTDAWCGIHASYTLETEPVIYTEDPYPGPGCSGSQWPQYFQQGKEEEGTADADSAVDTLSHEIDEAITDPQYNGSYAWYDNTGNEIGDDCADIFGAPKGSTDLAEAQQSEFNQEINGDRYWTQETFSDATYNAFKTGQGCVQKAFAPKGSAAPTEPAPDLGTGVVAASPLDLPADGTSTSTVTETVSKQDGEPVVADDVEFNVATTNGSTGTCGTLSGGASDAGPTPNFAVDVMTDDSGQASVTYTASEDEVPCSVIATEAQGGTTDTVTIYQGGEAQEEAPTISAVDLPSSLTAGAAPVTFTTTASNPGADDLDGTLQTIYLAGDDSGTSGLDSSEVKLTYANVSTGGQFVAVPLSGTTLQDGVISGTTLPAVGTTLPAGEAETTTWQLSLASSAPATSATGSQLYLETDLDQVDASSGATANLDYDNAYSTVIAAASSPPVLTPTTVTTTVIEPTSTIIEMVPASPAAAVRCTVPKLFGQSPTQTRARLKAAKCTSATLVEPTHKRTQKLIVRRVSPKAGSRVPAGGEITVTFKAVSASAARKAVHHN